jgi:predicted amidohydrolase YtcJ
LSEPVPLRRNIRAAVVVLSDDYFDPFRVTDEEIRKLHSVLTVVNGKVVITCWTVV